MRSNERASLLNQGGPLTEQRIAEATEILRAGDCEPSKMRQLLADRWGRSADYTRSLIQIAMTRIKLARLTGGYVNEAEEAVLRVLRTAEEDKNYPMVLRAATILASIAKMPGKVRPQRSLEDMTAAELEAKLDAAKAQQAAESGIPVVEDPAGTEH